jgi:hypothetical protein
MAAINVASPCESAHSPTVVDGKDQARARVQVSLSDPTAQAKGAFGKAVGHGLCAQAHHSTGAHFNV